MGQRGRLRVYLGAGPGAGTTSRLLDEGTRLLVGGVDVVVACLEPHASRTTAERIGRLPVVPPRSGRHLDADVAELDLAAVLERRPQIALVDGLAQPAAPGAARASRWQDVEALLAAGIDVLSTVDVRQLESISDVAEAITGLPVTDTVPDAVVRAAEQVELVDGSAGAAIARPDTLAALRELALLWLAGSPADELQAFRQRYGVGSLGDVRERVVVALAGGPEGEALIRRAARIAERAGGGELLAVHIARSGGLRSVAALDAQRVLVESLGGSFHSIIGEQAADGVLDFARAKNATQIVIGASRRHPLLAALTGPGTGLTITRRSGSIDVHVLSHSYPGRGRALPRLTGGLTRRRRLAGLLVAAAVLAALVAVCSRFRSDLSFGSDLLLFLLAVVICALIGGFWPALAAAVAASVLLNFYFAEPLHTLTISEPQNILALAVFVLIAVLVSRVVDQAARRSAEAARANAEAETLATLAGSLLRGEQALPALLQRVQETFAVGGAALMRTGGPAGWQVLAAVGEPTDPGGHGAGWPDAEVLVPIGDDLVLALRGRRLAAEDQRMLVAFATEVAVAYRQRQLAEVAAAARELAETDRARTALLNAVSHDLRTPIAAAKAAVSSLRSTEVAWTETDRRELLGTADRALDRLTALVTNLLDLSRLQAGALSVDPRPVGVDDLVNRALATLSAPAAVQVAVPAELPAVLADAGLAERVIANVLENALRYSPAGVPVRVSADRDGGLVALRVIDHGPGIPDAAKAAVFAPFQRRDDRAVSTGAGVGLGLAIARGFVEAMHGRIELADTLGGGLIVTIALPAAGESTAR